MIRSNTLMGRILIGSAIGGLLGLVLLLMGIAVVIHALDGREVPSERGMEIERRSGDEDHAPDYDEHSEDPYYRDEGEYPAAEASEGELAPAYPHDVAPPPVPVQPYVAEPLPPGMRSQWRSIFEDDEPVVRRAPVPSQPASPPAAATAPVARPAPRAPAAPRTPPEAKKDEESLFY